MTGTASPTIHTTSAVSTAVIGTGATLFAWLFPGLAVEFIGGQAYVELSPLIWAFAAVGTIWAMIQLLVYNVVARQNKRNVVVVWVGLVTLVGLSPAVHSITFLLTAVVVVESAVLLVLVGLSIRRTGVPTGITPA